MRTWGYVLLSGALLWLGCRSDPPPPPPAPEAHAVADSSLSDVLSQHAEDLMAIHGVTMVYEGELEDGQPCLVIGVRSMEEVADAKLPKELGGYPVDVRVSGDIRPMSGN